MMRGARRAAAAADRPRRAARHRPGVRASCAGVTLLDIDGLQAQVARAHISVRRGRGAPRRGDRRGGDPGVRRLARLARGDADARGAARARPTRSSTQVLAENEGRWETLGRARPRARRGARRGRPSSGCCTSRRVRRQGARTPTSATRACSCCASCSGSRTRRRRPARRAARPAEVAPLRPVDALRIGTRGSALALAQARAVAARCRRAAEIVDDHHRRRPRRARAATSRAGRARSSARCWRARSTSPCTRPRTCRASSPTGTAIVAAPRARRPARRARRRASLDALREGARVGTSALRRRAQLLAARPDLEVVELRGNVDTRLRKLAAGEVDVLVLAAAGPRPARPRRRGGGALDGAVFVPAPGQGSARGPGARGRRPRMSRRVDASPATLAA